MKSQVQEIENLIERLNDAWLNDKLENMTIFLHKQVVLREPGSKNNITGREEMIESYREFVESAEVEDFNIRDLFIDVFENTAIAFYTFRIRYRVESTRYDESGSETLVFNRHNDHWIIVWRTQQPG